MLYQHLRNSDIQNTSTQSVFNKTVIEMLNFLKGEAFCDLKKIEGLLLFSLDLVKDKKTMREMREDSQTDSFSNPGSFENRFENRVDIGVKILKNLESKNPKTLISAMKECGIDTKLYKKNPLDAVTKAIMCSFANRVDRCIQILNVRKSIDNEIKQAVLKENGTDIELYKENPVEAVVKAIKHVQDLELTKNPAKTSFDSVEGFLRNITNSLIQKGVKFNLGSMSPFENYRSNLMKYAAEQNGIDKVELLLENITECLKKKQGTCTK